MKFKKFAKDQATCGLIYERKNGERWLASESVLMLISDGVQSVTGMDIQPMPEVFERMVHQVGNTIEASLVEAIMPEADGGIKDCLRVYSTDNCSARLPIRNADWALIEKKDECEILVHYNLESGQYEHRASLVKQYPTMPVDDMVLTGIILPVADAV